MAAAGDLVQVTTLEGHKGIVWDVAWDPSGKLLASCGGDKDIRIWGQEGDAWVCKTLLSGGHRRTVRRGAWSPCGGRLATASFDGTVSVWQRQRDTGEFECAATLEGHESEVKGVAWAASGQLLATCGRDKSVWVWEVDEDDDYECASVLSGAHTQDVKCVLWHPNQEILVSTSYDNSVCLFKEEVDDWECFAKLLGHESTVWGVSFDRTADRLVTCSDDLTVKIWRQYLPGNQLGVSTDGKNATWKCVCTLSGYHSRPVYAVHWCPLTGLIATACGDDAIRVFAEDTASADPDAPCFHLVATAEKAHDEDVNSVCWHPTLSGLLASCGDDATVKLWQFSGEESLAV